MSYNPDAGAVPVGTAFTRQLVTSMCYLDLQHAKLTFPRSRSGIGLSRFPLIL